MVSVLDCREPSSVHPAGGVVTVTPAVLLVTKSSMPSPARTEDGMVTRGVVWLKAPWAEARKATLSAA